LRFGGASLLMGRAVFPFGFEILLIGLAVLLLGLVVFLLIEIEALALTLTAVPRLGAGVVFFEAGFEAVFLAGDFLFLAMGNFGGK